MTPKSCMDSAKLAVTLAASLPLGSSSKGMSRAKGRFCGALWDTELFRPNPVPNYALLFQSNFLTLVGLCQVVVIVDTNCSFKRNLWKIALLLHVFPFKLRRVGWRRTLIYGNFWFVGMASSKHIAWHYQATVCQFSLASEQGSQYSSTGN